jgi:hypothetical protein
MARIRAIASAVTGASWVLAAVVTVSTLQVASSTDLPPIVWTCPMHAEIVEHEKGTCPLCQMELVRSRMKAIWTCPIHALIANDKRGACPICGRALISHIMVMSFHCPKSPEVAEQLEPGACPDGTPMEVKRAPRAHGNHNAQHGGQFFMLRDNTHHIEGTYPAPGLLRIFLYDDYTRALPPDQVTQASGRIVTQETFDPGTNTIQELKQYPLTVSDDGASLEARIETLTLPAQVVAHVKLTADAPEDRFDFTFPAYSIDAKDVLPDVPATAARLEIPSRVEDVLSMLRDRKDAIRAAVERGAFDSIWVPALQAKDLALALEVYAAERPATEQARITAIVKRVVRSAWLLDTYGDMGNRQQISRAEDAFAAAVAELETAFLSSAVPPARH